VRADGRWAKPCLAYIVIARPDAAAAEALCAVQQQIVATEPGLLMVPPEAMHMTVARLLPVHGDDQAKQAVWDSRAQQWLTALRASAAAIQPTDIVLDELVATDTAIIAAGPAPAWVRELRATVIGLPEVGEYVISGELAHLTLLRYQGRLGDPAGLLDSLAGLAISVRLPAADLHVIRELRFPCLDYELVATLPTRHGRFVPGMI
jgi:hypothetical protein